MNELVHILGIRIQNFKSLRDITLGMLQHTQRSALSPLTVVIGKNGTGKSSLIDVFGFLSDCVSNGVESACNEPKRGGYQRIRSSGVSGPITVEVYYRATNSSLPMTYVLSIDLDTSFRPYVQKEVLQQGDMYFLNLTDGKGDIWDEDAQRLRTVELEDKRKLGIATLGVLASHPEISSFRKFIENWYVSYFFPDAARTLPLSGMQHRLNMHGDNLGNVVQFMEQEYPGKFQDILNSIAKKIPGIQKIEAVKTVDGRVLLRFNDRGFQDPFYAQQMSDGTLKVFAYMLLLADPTPPSFIGIEEPENGLYHKLLESFVQELRRKTKDTQHSTQIFITTHQPYLVDALSPEEVWILTKEDDGFSSINRASDIPLVKNLCAEGLPLGGLWCSDYLEEQNDTY